LIDFLEKPQYSDKSLFFLLSNKKILVAVRGGCLQKHPRENIAFLIKTFKMNQSMVSQMEIL
jgi:hypothetical protein